jgi:hypothetical protein
VTILIKIKRSEKSNFQKPTSKTIRIVIKELTICHIWTGSKEDEEEAEDWWLQYCWF